MRFHTQLFPQIRCQVYRLLPIVALINRNEHLIHRLVHKQPERPSQDQGTKMSNDLETYFAAKMQDPRFRDSYEDAEAIDQLIDALVERRRSLGSTQTDVSAQMGVKQPTVSGFEKQDSDPRVSTLQRYARAIGARITFELEAKDERGQWIRSLRCGTWSTSHLASMVSARWEDEQLLVRGSVEHYANRYVGSVANPEAFAIAA